MRTEPFGVWERSLYVNSGFFFVIPQKCCCRLLHIIRENRNNYLIFRLLLEVFLTTTLRTMYLQTWNKTLQLSRLHDSSWSKINALPLWPLQRNHFSIMGLENWNNCFGKCEYQEKKHTLTVTSWYIWIIIIIFMENSLNWLCYKPLTPLH